MKTPGPHLWMSALRRQLRRPLFREPMLHFLLIGVAVFAGDRALRADDRIIRISPSVRKEVGRALEAQLGHPAQASELGTEIERWKQQEALYREGLKLRLLEKDPVVREHLASKLLEIARSRSVMANPTESELRNYLERHLDLYTAPTTYDFDQVFVSQTHDEPRTHAEQLLSQLRAGASPDKLGDPFLLGHRISGETLSRLSELFGPLVAKGLPGYSVGEWNLVEGQRGFHVLRVTRVDRPVPEFDKLREVLIIGLNAERQESAAQAFAREIEGRYRFVSSE